MKRGAGSTYDIIATVLFIALIAFPFAAGLTGMRGTAEVSKRENRQLAPKPKFDLTFLDPYPAQYEKWYNDHFTFREQLIDLHIWTLLNQLRESPYPELVTIGQQGWLYDAGKERALYEGKVHIKPEGYNYLMRELHLRTLWCRARGIRFYVAFAPLKHEIYPEFLPAYYRRAPAGTLTDRLVNVIRKDTVIRLITFKEALLAEKKNQRLYSKMDNHWNFLGGYVAYRTLMEEIRKDFPQLRTLERGDFEFRETSTSYGNLAGMIGLGGKEEETVWIPVFPNQKSQDDTYVHLGLPDPFPMLNDSAVRRVIPGSNLPSVMVIRDSYSIYLFPYLAETFGKTFIYFDGWNYHLNEAVIAQEKPDIVILVIFEPHVKNILYNSLDLVMAEYNRNHPAP